MLEEKNYDMDEKKDKEAISFYLEQSKDYTVLAKKLTEYFTKKYGSEFKGSVLFEYDPTGNVMTMTAYDQDRVFETEDELVDIAAHIRLLRKSRV